jgi:hypothetical protein
MKKITLLIVLALIIQGTVLSQPCLPSGITFTTQEQIDNFQTNHPNCTEIGGSLIVDGESIYNLDGLNVITSVGGNLQFMGCDILSSLTGLDNVTSLGGSLVVAGNDALFDLTGLEGLTSIGANLEARSNSYLIHFTGLDNVTSIGGGIYLFFNYNLTSFAGLNNLTSIGGELGIGTYGFPSGTWGNPALSSLTGLNKLTSIGGDIRIIGSDVLTSLSGLDNINAGSIDGLIIDDNPLLSTCAVLSVCEYLASPAGTITIQANASGCGDQYEVEYACQFVAIPDINLESEFSIYPNPAKKKLFITSENGMSIDEVIIYNQFGQKVLQENQILKVVDISMLRQGMYVVELMSNGLTMREKLIIE